MQGLDEDRFPRLTINKEAPTAPKRAIIEDRLIAEAERVTLWVEREAGSSLKLGPLAVRAE